MGSIRTSVYEVKFQLINSKRSLNTKPGSASYRDRQELMIK